MGPEEYTWSYKFLPQNDETRELRSVANASHVGGIICSGATTFLSFNIEYNLVFNSHFLDHFPDHGLSICPYNHAYVGLGLQIISLVAALGFFGASLHFSKKASKLEQKLFQEEQELRGNGKEI